MKLKTIYICKNCSFESPKWVGRCPDCESWNSLLEDTINVGKKLSPTPSRLAASEPLSLSGQFEIPERLSTQLSECDRVLGGGIMPGGLILLSGEPGIGKSTLTLQIAGNLAKSHDVLIVSGEESTSQISLRAQRLKVNEPRLKAVNEIYLENIIDLLCRLRPTLAIIDSIQIMASADIPQAAGTITQIRYCTEKLMEIAKSKNIAILIIGHVTKDGTLAGPRVLEHLVDTVMHLEGDRFHQLRLLRAAKNRFGSSSEVGIFEMTELGLGEVKDPSKQLLEGRKEKAIGSSITVTMEGTRPLLVEVQALTSVSPFGYPKRTANGFDLNRLQILIAVLEKHAKINLANQDVFVNIVGGVRLSEPAADLAVLMAIASSHLKTPLPDNCIIFGEVGLSGELRKVSQTENRNKEAKKLGFTEILSPEKYKEVSALVSTIR